MTARYFAYQCLRRVAIALHSANIERSSQICGVNAAGNWQRSIGGPMLVRSGQLRERSGIGIKKLINKGVKYGINSSWRHE
jgi:hypothetical protein